MPRERTYRTRAIILKHRDQGEADRVITAITPAQGKCTLIAKGVRKPASRKAGHLEPFTHVALLAAKARGWDIITQAESIHSFPGLRADIDRMAFAYYFAELVDAFTQEEDSQPEVYDLLLRALGYLEQGENLEMAARWFELRLLRLSGYQPQLFQCLECGEPLQPVTNYLSLVDKKGELELYHGGLRARYPDGGLIFDQFDYSGYQQILREEVRAWSYLKFPYLLQLGEVQGWYRVGPLARLNTCSLIPTPEAEAARRDFMALTKGRPNNITMCYHWARMIELLHAIEVIRDLLHDADLLENDLMTSGPRREEAVGVLEAPRGTLFHHYRVDASDAVTMCNLIVSTTNNNEPMNQAVTRVARDHFTGKAEITEALLNHIEVAVRAYDPCLSCATHALGRMALSVELVDAGGEVVAHRTRGGP